MINGLHWKWKIRKILFVTLIIYLEICRSLNESSFIPKTFCFSGSKDFINESVEDYIDAIDIYTIVRMSATILIALEKPINYSSNN